MDLATIRDEFLPVDSSTPTYAVENSVEGLEEGG